MCPLVDNNPPKFISPSTLEVSDNFFTPNGICHFFFPVIVDNEVILPIGSFPYIYALLDNVIQIKHIKKCAAARGGDANFVIQGYDPNNNSAGDGKICYSGLNDSNKKFVMTKSKDRAFGITKLLRVCALPATYNR